MRSPVLTAAPDDTIEAAASRMVVHAVHALPVVDGHGLHRPGELEMRRAVETARNAVLQGQDADGVAAGMLYLHQRNGVLESLRRKIARYLQVGQDERLHASLLRELERSTQPGEPTALELPL